jgi:hypothetical protein
LEISLALIVVLVVNGFGAPVVDNDRSWGRGTISVVVGRRIVALTLFVHVVVAPAVDNDRCWRRGRTTVCGDNVRARRTAGDLGNELLIHLEIWIMSI